MEPPRNWPCIMTPVNHPSELWSSYVAIMRFASGSASPIHVPPGMPGRRFGRGLRIHRHSGQVGFDPSVNNIRSVWFSLAFWASPIPMHVTFHDSMSLIDAIVSRLPDPPLVSRSSSMHTPSALRNAIAVKKSGWELGVDRSSPCHVGPSPS